MSIGPIQAFVIGFPDSDLFEGRIAEELALLSDVGQIRIVDAVFVLRDGDDVDVVSVSDLDDEQRAELRTVGRRPGGPWCGRCRRRRGRRRARGLDRRRTHYRRRGGGGEAGRRTPRMAARRWCWSSSISGRYRCATPSATQVAS